MRNTKEDEEMEEIGVSKELLEREREFMYVCNVVFWGSFLFQMSRGSFLNLNFLKRRLNQQIQTKTSAVVKKVEAVVVGCLFFFYILIVGIFWGASLNPFRFFYV